MATTTCYDSEQQNRIPEGQNTNGETRVHTDALSPTQPGSLRFRLVLQPPQDSPYFIYAFYWTFVVVRTYK